MGEAKLQPITSLRRRKRVVLARRNTYGMGGVRRIVGAVGVGAVLGPNVLLEAGKRDARRAFEQLAEVRNVLEPQMVGHFFQRNIAQGYQPLRLQHNAPPDVGAGR